MARAELALLGGRPEVTLRSPVWPRAGAEERRAAAAAMKAAGSDPSWLTSASGEGVVADFERRFARKMGARHAAAMSGCGPALHTALLAAGVRPGDEVVCPAYSWGQSASCILHAAAIPVFADADPATFNITAETIAPKLSRHTRAIVVAHLFGQTADMDPILRLAKKRRIPVVEDAAQAMGALYKGRRAGTSGDFGCFSIGDGKQVFGGEGGVLLARTRKDFERAVFFGQHPARHARQLTDPELLRLSDSLIQTYRIHPLAAAICRAMLPKLDRLNAERRRNHALLSRGLRGIPGIRTPAVGKGCRHVYHKYCPSFVPEELPGLSRERFAAALHAEGVPVSLGYVRIPLHLRPRMLERRFGNSRDFPWRLHPAGKRIRYRGGDCPQAERICARTELVLAGGACWVGDQSRLIRQIIRAFEKVVSCRDVLARARVFRLS